jgi:diguanylate cyclase (GGDEF)-like protein
VAGDLLADGPGRVYFHSRHLGKSHNLPSGAFIRKPCAPAVFDVLWAGAETRAKRAVCGTTSMIPKSVPAWLLDLHELDLRSFCRKCVSCLGPRLGYRNVSLYLYDGPRGLLTLAETTHGRAIDQAIPIGAVSQHLMSAVALNRRPFTTDKVSAELKRRNIPAHGDREYADQACMIVPLLSDGQLWGVLNMSGSRRTELTEEDAPLEQIFRFLGAALHHACAHEQARTEARVDGLTGLFNQRWMMEALEREIRRCERFGSSLCVLMLDVDGLKGVNDREGHAAGDCLLRHLAARIGAVLRQFDGAARVGGDEFVIMLPSTGLSGARRVALRLLQLIREDRPFFRDVALQVTASIGAAEWRRGWGARDLVDAADQAMYRAKQRGRDGLACLAGEGCESGLAARD